MAAKNPTLPKAVQPRLQPFIDKGIQNGIFQDAKPVAIMFRRKADEMKDTVAELGGMRNANAQRFVANCVMTDLSAMLRTKSYTAHMQILKLDAKVTRTGRQMANLFGQVSIEDGDSVMDSALFKMSLWDEDASIVDDVETGNYVAQVTCRNLDVDVLDLRPLSGMTIFTEEEYEHGDVVQLLRDTYDTTPIAELEDSISRNRNDYRLVEATVSYAGVQNSKSGSTFGKMLLKDESTMTIEAIESGENLLLNALCDTNTANSFGKYSEILALVTTSMNEQYGLSASIECAVGVVVIAPPQPETPASGDDSSDDASSYFSSDNIETMDLDDDSEESEDSDSSEGDSEPASEPETDDAVVAKPAEDGEWTDGEEDDWEDDWE